MPLTFSSEKDRLNHPLASLIPLPVWKYIFESQLTGLQLTLLSTTTSQFVLRDQTNLADVICLFIAHRQMNDREFLLCLNRLSISTEMLNRVLQGLIIVHRNQLALSLITLLSTASQTFKLPSYQELTPLVAIKEDANKKIILLGLKAAIKGNNVTFTAS